MICVICKTGTCKPGKTHFSAFVKDAFVVVKNVDALICENCGEAYYDADTTRYIQEQTEQAYHNIADVEVMKV
jgi:YgiT-type zinc finger domain-containing protein